METWTLLIPSRPDAVSDDARFSDVDRKNTQIISLASRGQSASAKEQADIADRVGTKKEERFPVKDLIEDKGKRYKGSEICQALHSSHPNGRSTHPEWSCRRSASHPCGAVYSSSSSNI